MASDALMPNPTALREIIERLEKLERQSAGSGHSVHFGGSMKRRYDTETGEPYYQDDPGYLRTSSQKMRAIWELWEMLPTLLALFRALEQKP